MCIIPPLAAVAAAAAAMAASAATSTAMSCGGGCHPAARSALTQSSAVSFVTTSPDGAPMGGEMNAPSVGSAVPGVARGNGDTAAAHRPAPTLYAAGGHGTVIGESNGTPHSAETLCLYGFASRDPIHCVAGTHPVEAANAFHRAVLSTGVPGAGGRDVRVHPGGNPCSRSASWTSSAVSPPPGINTQLAPAG